MPNVILTFLGALGGICVFITSVILVIKAIMKQVTATEANTIALREMRIELRANTAAIGDHETRLTVIERQR